MKFQIKSPTRNFRTLEAAAIGVWAFAIYLAASLGSWTANDPTWLQAFAGQEVNNLMGRLGAGFGDGLFTLLGLAAWLLPMMLIYAGLQLLRHDYQQINWARLGLMTLSWLVLLVSSSALVSLSIWSESALREGSGGFLGAGIALIGTPIVGHLGLALALIVVAGIALQFVFDFSWVHVCGVIGEWLQRGVVDFFDRLRDVRSRLAELIASRQKPARASTARRRRSKGRQAPHIGAGESLGEEDSQETGERTRRKPRITKTPPSKQVPVQGSLIASQGTEEMPPLDMLDNVRAEDDMGYDDESLQAMSALLESKLQEFGIDAKVRDVVQGPVITRYELELAPGVRSVTVRNLQRDLARSLAVQSVRVVDVIEGKTLVGIELPNTKREVIRLRTLIGSDIFKKHKSPLLIALGKDTKGDTRVADLADMPHLLMAGTTGAGKSVGINAMLLSILYRASPKDVRLILIDPKMVELSVYEGIPHLLTPVITEMPDTVRALRWCTEEMDRRYKLMNELSVRSLSGYNERVTKLNAEAQDGEAKSYEGPLPNILLVIDEFADMMAVVRKQVEEPISRLAAKARAAGIHLVLATQRPSKDVITGIIKANIASRISYQVSQKVDSMVVLDQIGAEQLLGRGDMMFRFRGQNAERLHGAFVTDSEVARVVEDWRRRGEPEYLPEVLEAHEELGDVLPGTAEEAEGQDEYYSAAVDLVRETGRASISLVQRQFRIGYNRAANIMDAMERAGVVSAPGHDNTREVLDPSRD